MPVDELRRSVTHLMQCFLDTALETQFVILENGDHEDEYVQFKLNNRILYAEVGSREWSAAEDCRPLDADARSRLAHLGSGRTAVRSATTSATTSLRKARRTWPIFTCDLRSRRIR